MLGGYANKIGFVNLSPGSVELKDSPDDWKLKYVGGRGMGVKHVFENGPGVDPLSPENILCFMNGPLTGTPASWQKMRVSCSFWELWIPGSSQTTRTNPPLTSI